jgi:hypothetical protein
VKYGLQQFNVKGTAAPCDAVLLLVAGGYGGIGGVSASRC